MIELSYRNHFRFGYGDADFAPRRDVSQRWRVSYGRCERRVGNWGEECVATARLIRESTTEPIWVLFSGGIDSEVVVQSFRRAGIPIQAAILRFNDDLNLHDIHYAVTFCEENGISYRFFDLDILNFFESGVAMEYAHATQSVSPQFLASMWCMDRVEGYPVLGSAECYLVKRSEFKQVYGGKAEWFSNDGLEGSPDSWDLWEKEKVAALYRHLVLRGRNGCAGFFQFNPENMLAFLQEPTVVDLVNNRIPDKISTDSSKPAIYGRHFRLAPRTKYTGYENLRELDKKYRTELEAAYPAGNSVYRTPYSRLIRELSFFSA